MADVVIIQEHLPHYRVAFFEGLREALSQRGISLGLVYGEGWDPRMLTTPLPWATPVKIRRLGPFAWHSWGGACRGAKLVIVPQETKYLRCHLKWLGSRILRRPAFAYWGHGRNFQAKNPGSAAERIKRLLSRHVDWWFAYNDLSARVVRDLGFPDGRITAVGNTVNTDVIARTRDAVTAKACEELREKLRVTEGPVGLFAGALYGHKRIPFLLAAAEAVRASLPDFQLLVMGSGPEVSVVEEAARRHAWIHFLGPLRDEEKAAYWKISDVLLMPGLVGLVIVDSFLFGVPMVTTDYPHHSPEIDYLKSGENGLVVTCGEDAGAYAEALVRLLSDASAVARLRAGALDSAPQHQLSVMVGRFADGISSALLAGFASSSDA